MFPKGSTAPENAPRRQKVWKHQVQGMHLSDAAKRRRSKHASTSSSGSNSSPQDSTSTKPRHHGVNSSQKTRIPPSVDAGPTTRSQMLIVALYHYLPTNEPKEHRGEHEHPRLTFLNLFNGAIFRPRAPFLAAAIDSFTLVQASLALGDVRLGFAAIRRYSACLSKFNAALAESNLYSHDDILLCMLVLSILEVSGNPISFINAPLTLSAKVNPSDLSIRWLGISRSWCNQVS